MNSDKLTEIAAESYFVGRFIDAIAAEHSDFDGRELRIQNFKLQRMLFDVPLRSQLGSGSSKTSAKKVGARDAAIGKQFKFVRQLANQKFKEFIRKRNPKLTNKGFQEWRNGYEAAITKQVARMVGDVKVKVQERLREIERPKA